MPVEKVNALQRIKDILKSMAERQIILNKDMNLTITKVIEYSNEMSMKHTDLKAEILAVSWKIEVLCNLIVQGGYKDQSSKLCPPWLFLSGIASNGSFA